MDVMECHDTPFFEICKVCNWMYNEVDREQANTVGGNYISFNEAKRIIKNW